MPAVDAPADLAQHRVRAATPRGAAHEWDHAEAARERAAVLDLHERAHAIDAGVTADAADRADVTRDERGCLLRATIDDDDVLRKAAEALTAEVRAAAGDVDARVRPRRARGGLAALRERLVRHAAAADDGHVGRRAVRRERMPVRKQTVADLEGIDVRHLAAEESDVEPRHARDRTAVSGVRGGPRPNRRVCGARAAGIRAVPAPRSRGSPT